MTSEYLCDRIVNNGMGEPTECGRTLPCDHHDSLPAERDEPVTAAGRDWLAKRHRGEPTSEGGKMFRDADRLAILAIEREAATSSVEALAEAMWHDGRGREAHEQGYPIRDLYSDDEWAVVENIHARLTRERNGES